MTPQERQLVSELFDRLEKLEGTRRDPDAERTIVDGFDRAPNAAYALVQTVLVQDEALKRANARIEELEASLQGEAPREERGGFLDNMRDMLSGREGGRGSVPSVRPGAAPGEGSSGRWNMGGHSQAPAGGGYYEPQGAPPPPQSAGGSFLGTAAATAAGVVGGALLMNSIRGMFGPSHGQASSAFDPGLSGGGGRTPWGGGDASNSDLARDAGLGDIGSGGGGRSAAYDDDRRAGLFGNNDDDQQDGDDDSDDGDDIAGGFDSDDSDTA